MDKLVSSEHLDLLATYLDASQGLIAVRYGSDHTILAANRVFLKELGVDKHSPLGDSINQYLRDPDGRDCSMLSTATEELPTSFTVLARPSHRTYMVYLYPDGNDYFLIGERVTSSDSEELERMSLMTNELARLTIELRKRNSDLEEANETIRELTRLDPLTGLSNRRHFAEELDKAITMAQRHRHPLSLISLDLDRFKTVNDTYGHDVGDQALKGLAHLLRDSCRNEDLPVRLGGEEFIILAPNTAVDEAYALAERLRERLANTDLTGKDRVLTASIGVTQLLENDTYFAFMKRADLALYESKSSGRNKTSVRMTNDMRR